MEWKEFFLELLRLISFDILFGFIVWNLYKYIDLKYFSSFEITTLKQETEYLKQENQKLNGTSTFFNEEDKL